MAKGLLAPPNSAQSEREGGSRSRLGTTTRNFPKEGLLSLLSQRRSPHKSDLTTRGLLWQSGPKTHQLQSRTGLGLFINQARCRRPLRPIDTEGGSLLDLVQTFCFWGALSISQVTVWKTTWFSQQPCSPFIQFVPSFFPSFIEPTSLLHLYWMLGPRRGIGSIPALGEHPGGTHQLPSASLLLSLRHRSGLQEPLSPRALRPGQSPRWRDTHGNPERKR